MTFLTREEFAARARLAVQLRSVTVDGVGTVGVQAMTGLDWQEHVRERGLEMSDDESERTLRKWVARLVCDEDRRPLFDGPDDAALLSLPAMVLLRFGIDVLNAASGLTDEDESAEGKAVPAGSASGG